MSSFRQTKKTAGKIGLRENVGNNKKILGKKKKEIKKKENHIKMTKNEFFFNRPNVCPHEELEVVTVRRPCVRAFTKYVRSRKANCPFGLSSTACTVREPKLVQKENWNNIEIGRMEFTKFMA